MMSSPEETKPAAEAASQNGVTAKKATPKKMTRAQIRKSTRSTGRLKKETDAKVEDTSVTEEADAEVESKPAGEVKTEGQAKEEVKTEEVKEEVKTEEVKEEVKAEGAVEEVKPETEAALEATESKASGNEASAKAVDDAKPAKDEEDMELEDVKDNISDQVEEEKKEEKKGEPDVIVLDSTDGSETTDKPEEGDSKESELDKSVVIVEIDQPAVVTVQDEDAAKEGVSKDQEETTKLETKDEEKEGENEEENEEEFCVIDEVSGDDDTEGKAAEAKKASTKEEDPEERRLRKESHGFMASVRRYRLESKLHFATCTVLVERIKLDDVFKPEVAECSKNISHFVVKVKSLRDQIGYMELQFKCPLQAKEAAEKLRSVFKPTHVHHTDPDDNGVVFTQSIEAMCLDENYMQLEQCRQAMLQLHLKLSGEHMKYREDPNPDKAILLFGIRSDTTVTDILQAIPKACNAFIPYNSAEKKQRCFAYVEFHKAADVDGLIDKRYHVIKERKHRIMQLINTPDIEHVLRKCDKVVEMEPKRTKGPLGRSMFQFFDQMERMAYYFKTWGSDRELGANPEGIREKLKNHSNVLKKILLEEDERLEKLNKETARDSHKEASKPAEKKSDSAKKSTPKAAEKKKEEESKKEADVTEFNDDTKMEDVSGAVESDANQSIDMEICDDKSTKGEEKTEKKGERRREDDRRERRRSRPRDYSSDRRSSRNSSRHRSRERADKRHRSGDRDHYDRDKYSRRHSPSRRSSYGSSSSSSWNRQSSSGSYGQRVGMMGGMSGMQQMPPSLMQQSGMGFGSMGYNMGGMNYSQQGMMGNMGGGWSGGYGNQGEEVPPGTPNNALNLLMGLSKMLHKTGDQQLGYGANYSKGYGGGGGYQRR